MKLRCPHELSRSAPATVHRLEVSTECGRMTFDVSGWPGDVKPSTFRFAVDAAETLRSGLAEPRWRHWFLPAWIREVRRDLMRSGVNPLTCTVAVVQNCDRGHKGYRHGYVNVHRTAVRPQSVAA